VEEIGKSLPGIFKRHVQRTGSQLVEVLAPMWAQVAGRAVAEHSRPVAFWSGTLTLATPSDTWAAQLRLLAPEILEAVNAFLGGAVIKELRVNLVPGLAPSKFELRGSQIETRDRTPFRIAPCEFPGGLDSETKNVLERSFSKYFARGEKRLG
jgi:hypothetical protein